jgi:hypothetical protein
LVFVVLFSVTSLGEAVVCLPEALLANLESFVWYGQDTKTASKEAILRKSRIQVSSLQPNNPKKVPQSHSGIPRRRTGSKHRTNNKHTNHHTKTEQMMVIY